MDQTVPLSAALQIRNEYAEVWVNDEIVYCRFVSNLHMTIDIAKKCVQMRLDFQNNVPMLILVDLSDIRSITSEAREYMAKEGSQLIKAGALLISSPVSRIIGNIFLSLNRPKAPARLFNDAQAAVSWLKTFA